jgi:hypothetical protein
MPADPRVPRDGRYVICAAIKAWYLEWPEITRALTHYHSVSFDGRRFTLGVAVSLS